MNITRFLEFFIENNLKIKLLISDNELAEIRCDNENINVDIKDKDHTMELIKELRKWKK
jgi:hypothetical protein|tara:strand:- start:789 stop:965 length:177 start_codon:yes stop_codon:yes gene_type:complete